jgi:hypothetical protein
LWHTRPRRDGTPHTLSEHVAISMSGKDNEANGIGGKNFAEKWQHYEDAWSTLE